jgi:cell division protein FtsQ
LSTTKINIRKIGTAILWFAVAGAGIVLLQAGVRSQNVKVCKAIDIEISGVSNNFFIDSTDVQDIIKNYVGGNPRGKKLASFNLRDIESRLEKDVWIRNAELFFDNNDILRVHVDEREPAARIFAMDGNTFYIDSSLKRLPLSEKFSARLPVFTGFPVSNAATAKSDSALLRSVLIISEQLQKDSFLMAMIDQVDINPQRNFEMIPKLGKQTILFGDATDAEEKFKNLKTFYKQVINVSGWSKYSSINLQFKNQVVAKIKDAEDKSADSLRTLQIMQLIAERAARQAADSMQTFLQDNEKNTGDGSMIIQSVERDEPTMERSSAGNSLQTNPFISSLPDTALKTPTAPVVTKPAVVAKPVATTPKPVAAKPKPVVAKPKPAAVKKPAAKPATSTPKPRAVMKGNDY